MDLGLQGKKAIVCAASKGLGKACALALAEEGVDLVITARTKSTLEATAREIAEATGVSVIPVTGDIATEEGRAEAIAACPAPDILVNNAGGPPPGDFREWGEEEWILAIQTNMLAPIFLIKSVVDGMIDRRFGRIVNITSGSVKAPIPNIGLSNGARTGLTGFVAGLARQVVEYNVTINNLLPGQFETDRLRENMESIAKKQGSTAEEVSEARRKANPALRFGDPEEFGHACAFLCSARSSYISGQNLLLDGGHYPGTL